MDEIDSIITTTAAIDGTHPSFMRADKNKEINDLIASWSNPQSILLESGTVGGGASNAGGKSIIISNVPVSGNFNLIDFRELKQVVKKARRRLGNNLWAISRLRNSTFR